MSNYTKATNFAIKDGLVTTDPAKIIKGTEIDNEYNAIANAISSKADVNSPSLTGTPTAPTASAGTNTNQIATTSFVNSLLSGVIVMWSGSTSSIPVGWLLCNGSNGTPDLRNRFIVGAGSTYAVGATGGSADATLVSHTHGVSDPGHTHGVADPGHAHGLESAVGRYGYGSTFGVRGDYPVPRADALGATAGSGTGIGIYGAATGISIQGSGTSATNANLPPYYALAYIMKS